MQPPKHYGDTSLMDYLISHNLGFAEGNICKYVVRWKEKDGIKDLYKARDYLNAVISHEELKVDSLDKHLMYPAIHSRRSEDRIPTGDAVQADSQ